MFSCSNLIESEGKDFSIKSDGDFTKCITKDCLDGVNFQTLAQKFIDLPKPPRAYHYSVIIFKVLKEEEMDELQKAYPSKYVPLEFRGTLEERCDNTLMAQELIEKAWRQEIEEGIRKYFKPKHYKNPVVVLMKYGRCGCSLDSDRMGCATENKTELKCSSEWYDHTPWDDTRYHDVLMLSPLRLSQDKTMADFWSEVVSRVNEYGYKQKLFDLKEHCEVWYSFIRILRTAQTHNKVPPEILLKHLNVFIEKYNSEPDSPVKELVKSQFPCKLRVI